LFLFATISCSVPLCAARTPVKLFHSFYRFLFLLLEYWQRRSLVGPWSVRHLVLSLGALSSCIKVSISVSAARKIWFCPCAFLFSVPLDFSQHLGRTHFAAGSNADLFFFSGFSVSIRLDSVLVSLICRSILPFVRTQTWLLAPGALCLQLASQSFCR
jgi:hypothetical protein